MAQMILSPKEEQIMDMESSLVVAWVEVEEKRGWTENLGLGRCKLLHLEQISNGVLLYSTGNCVQSLGLEHDGRQFGKKKERVYICICLCVCVCIYMGVGWIVLLYSRN